jgi:hypothetical protein
VTSNKLILALAAAGAAGLGFATVGVAHPHPDGQSRKVIVLTDHETKGEHRRDGKHRIRTFRHHRGPGHGASLVHCEGERREIGGGESEDGKKTRIILCSKGGDSAAQAEKLERALERVQANDHLEGEHKEKVVAALREALERLRSGQ